MNEVTLHVNGVERTVDVNPVTPLLYVLRNDLGLRGPSSQTRPTIFPQCIQTVAILSLIHI